MIIMRMDGWKVECKAKRRKRRLGSLILVLLTTSIRNFEGRKTIERKEGWKGRENNLVRRKSGGNTLTPVRRLSNF